jgi:hypothetical protein
VTTSTVPSSAAAEAAQAARSTVSTDEAFASTRLVNAALLAENDLANNANGGGAAQFPRMGSFRFPAQSDNNEAVAVARLRALASSHRDPVVAERLGGTFAAQVPQP